MWWSTVLLVGSALAQSSQPLSIQLTASWPAAPLVLEILETIYDESPSSYFPLLRHLTSLPPDLSDRDLLSAAKEMILFHDLLPETSWGTFDLALTLHTASPKIEAFYTWYEANVVGETPEILLPFDHISAPTGLSQAIFYFDPSSPSSSPLLGYLDHHASQYPSFRYVVRYAPPKNRHEGPKTQLSGYGVEMVLKKTDYLVVDDRTSRGKTQAHSKSTQGTSSANHSRMFEILGDDPWDQWAEPLTKSEVQNLGLQASALIMSSEDKLDALLHLSQDFPKYSAAIARNIDIPQNLAARREHLLTRGPASPTLVINGRNFKSSDMNAFSLLNTIRAERHHILSLSSLGLTPKQAFELLADPLIGQSQTSDDPTEGMVDASDRDEGGKAITWWNNIERDKRYSSWPKQMQGYLRPLYPGQFHSIRRNTFNLVFVLDLASVPSLDIIAASISGMIQRGVPVRFGIVPMVSPEQEDISMQMARVFLYAVKTFGRGVTRDMLNEILKASPSSPANPATVRLEVVERVYNWAAMQSDKESLPFSQVLESHEFDPQFKALQTYTERVAALKEDAPSGHLFLNGKHIPLNGHWATAVQSEIQTQLAFLQESIINKVPMEDVANFFYDLPMTAKRRNKLIVPTQIDNKLRAHNLLDVFKHDSMNVLTTNFVYADDYNQAPITIWIIADLDSSAGRRTVMDALESLQLPSNLARIGFVHVPSDVSATNGARLSTLIYKLMSSSILNEVQPSQLLDVIQSLEKGDSVEWKEGTPLHAFSSSGWSAADDIAAARFWEVGSTIGAELKIRSSHPHLLINGRLVGPITPRSFGVADFQPLATFEYRKRVQPVVALVATMYENINSFDRTTLAGMIATMTSIVSAAYIPPGSDGIFTPAPAPRSKWYEQLDDGDMSFSVGRKDTALVHVAAVVDPISEAAQRFAPILKMLSQMDHVAVSVYLEPDLTSTDLKLKRFYRSSLSPYPLFDVDGKSIAPGLTFTDLPTSPIYTLGLDLPPSFIVSPKTSPVDLDNILLSTLHDPTTVQFELKQLVIEGHARETTNTPPRGLQLQLIANEKEVSDTLVMINVGYLQFKVTPGVYDLDIRPGRGQEVYELESVGNEGWDSKSVNETGRRVTVTSFEGMTILPRFVRKKGMEQADVLQESEIVQPDSMGKAVFSRMKELVGIKPEETKPTTRHADINIFTVASGLLYERFASIMILSVMRHTQSSVKFWFIENFLSPTFLEFLPHLAEEYKFQYELVTYKWPSWLREQTEKQRIIWAYKILFLDVLFPMDLDKVIFVDADQIVRVDMKELVDVDLHGRVYGYAPMGDDREEMEGFRFWKKGYWRDALRGRPYHISALYVIDLKRFRQLATGDRLRSQYHTLSADPNSLANLDQDLPNSMQDQIPIYTLDQDWLWCQTWCSDESLARAKTIDLCQNPLTKEPKLVRARQIPEWDEYDREIAALAARIQGGSGLAGSVDDLAGEKGRESESEPVTGALSVEEHEEGDKEEEEREAKEVGEKVRRIDDEL
ncbi:hypothetical protein TREMEDRAFT_44060 [Tremella mesenterica DSM 1558]|uniref:uncharacterized protein n=1 Tax=Tremella mesenterica (strain ATCC 24925 / CBS 8224 / DSM 1558 / NBRC 9311 / NRRL Y-6157 / RJB 2259-6 / UBC 559-6) TaxID=578456 RepID=UPI0003F49F0A|nr:uncharacterized protein TREMEDRAFT_44060 [Tremella mesenterica DSM 1558]EIW69539.1 hypothetical protein TREMEDRAFT_44060 [Tremella mesenterica DSM 1558]